MLLILGIQFDLCTQYEDKLFYSYDGLSWSVVGIADIGKTHIYISDVDYKVRTHEFFTTSDKMIFHRRGIYLQEHKTVPRKFYEKYLTMLENSFSKDTGVKLDRESGIEYSKYKAFTGVVIT